MVDLFWQPHRLFHLVTQKIKWKLVNHCRSQQLIFGLGWWHSISLLDFGKSKIGRKQSYHGEYDIEQVKSPSKEWYKL